MRLPIELRLLVVSTDADGVTIQPEYWHENTCIERPAARKLKPGEQVCYGPYMTDVEFVPPIIPGG